jgi:hypothetical protein
LAAQGAATVLATIFLLIDIVVSPFVVPAPHVPENPNRR